MANVSDEEAMRFAREAKVIAVVGMVGEDRSDRPAYLIPSRLKRLGYRIIPVNPRIESSLGEKAYAALADVPEKADVVDVFRPVSALPGLADEILALPPGKRPGCVWFQTGITDPVVERRLEDAGMRVVSDRCLAVFAGRARP